MAYLRAWVNTSGDGTWSGTTNEILRITEVSTNNNFGDSVPTATITCIKGTNVKEGNEVRIYNSSSHEIPNSPSQADCIFRGIVQSINYDGITTSITCNNWLQNLVNNVSNKYAVFENQIIIDIVRYLLAEGFGNINNHITYDNILNYMAVVGDKMAAQYTKLECKNQSIFETLITLCEDMDYWFYYNYTDFKIWFKPRNTNNKITFELRKPGNTYTSGAIKLLEIPGWSGDVQNVATKTTVVGGAWDEYITGNVIDNGGHSSEWLWLTFNFPYVDLSSYAVNKVEILPIGSASWVQLNENSYYTKVEKSEHVYYYHVILDPNKCYQYINRLQNGRITLVKTVSEHPFTTPEYSSAVSKYGSRDKVVTNQNITNLNDLTSYANHLLSYWNKSTSRTSIKFKGNGNYLGYGVNVVDEYLGITKTYANYTDDTHWTGIVTDIQVSYPNPISTITVADHTIQNNSISALLNKTINSITNNYSNLKLGTALKTDGSKPVTDDIDITNKILKNLVIENVTNL